MNENYEGALAKIDAARKLARQTMAKHGKEEVCDPPMGIDTPQRPALPASVECTGNRVCARSQVGPSAGR